MCRLVSSCVCVWLLRSSSLGEQDCSDKIYSTVFNEKEIETEKKKRRREKTNVFATINENSFFSWAEHIETEFYDGWSFWKWHSRPNFHVQFTEISISFRSSLHKMRQISYFLSCVIGSQMLETLFFYLSISIMMEIPMFFFIKWSEFIEFNMKLSSEKCNTFYFDSQCRFQSKRNEMQ